LLFVFMIIGILVEWGEPYCCFDLHFIYCWGYWAFLHIFIGNLYFFWELSLQLIFPFIHWD
jgi:hypothetical protein